MEIIPYNNSEHDELIKEESLAGYVRGDIDKNNQMWTSFFSMDAEFENRPGRESLNRFMDWFVELDFLKSLDALYHYCKQFDTLALNIHTEKKYFFFAEDEYNYYKVIFSCLENDYNFYVRVYMK